MTKTFAMALEVPPDSHFTPGKWYAVTGWWGRANSPMLMTDLGFSCRITRRHCSQINGGDWIFYEGDEAPPDGWKPGDPDFHATLDLSNQNSQTFDMLSPEVQAGLRALPREEVETKYLLSGDWRPRMSTSLFPGGVYRQKPGHVTFHHPTLPPGEYIGPNGAKIIIKETDQ